MGNQKANEPKGHSVNFLLAEHEYLGDCFWRNEEIGERRVNFFITLVTAAIAALVALATSEEGNLKEAEVYLITVFALLALLSFGIVTLLRMIHRNTVTDGYKRAMEMIRSHFRNLDERLQDYQPFEKGKPRKLGTGGLVDMVALVNSVIVAALCALLAHFHSGLGIVLPGLVGFIAALIVQFVYVRYRYDTRKADAA
jgi:hypothetical protein